MSEVSAQERLLNESIVFSSSGLSSRKADIVQVHTRRVRTYEDFFMMIYEDFLNYNHN